MGWVDGSVGQWVKYWLHKPVDLSSDPQNLCESWIQWHEPVTTVWKQAGGQRHVDLWSSLPASLTKPTNYSGQHYPECLPNIILMWFKL